MSRLSSKRFIKPQFSTYRIIYTLNRVQVSIVVYDNDIPEENKAYSIMHNRLWELQKAGLIDYGRNIGGSDNTMKANITIKGSDWLANKNLMILNTVVSIIAAFASIIAISIH